MYFRSSPLFKAAFYFSSVIFLAACAITSPDNNPQPKLPTRVVNLTASTSSTVLPPTAPAQSASIAPTKTLANTIPAETATLTNTPTVTFTPSATPVQPSATPLPTFTPTATPIPVGFGFISRLSPKDAPAGSIEISSYEGVKVAADSVSLRVDAEYIGNGDFDSAVKKLADGKHPIIVVVGVDLSAATRKAATTFPSVKFVGVEQAADDTSLSNLYFVNPRSDEEGFIAGMIAGFITKSRVVGVIVPNNNNNLEAKRYSNGFTQGVRYSCGICQTIVTQFDVEKDTGAQVTARLQRQKVDALLVAMTGDLGAEATKTGATTGGLWVIGLGRDYGATLNGGGDRVAISVLRKSDEVLAQLIKSLMNGNAAKTTTLTSTNGSLRLSPKFSSDLSPAVVKLIKDSFELLATGLLDIGVDFASGDVK